MSDGGLPLIPHPSSLESYACLVLGNGIFRLRDGHWQLPERLYLADASRRIRRSPAFPLPRLQPAPVGRGPRAAVEPGAAAGALPLLRDEDLVAVLLGGAAECCHLGRDLVPVPAWAGTRSGEGHRLCARVPSRIAGAGAGCLPRSLETTFVNSWHCGGAWQIQRRSLLPSERGEAIALRRSWRPAERRRQRRSTTLPSTISGAREW